MVFPETNQQLKTQAKYNGYYFEGRTSIMLDGDSIKIRNKGNSVQTINDLKNGVIYVDGTVVEEQAPYRFNNKWNSDLGNVFVSGTMNGRLTIATSNDIYITGYDPTEFDFSKAKKTGGIKYYDTTFDGQGNVVSNGDDMLGLVANKYIFILHYGWFGKMNNTSVALNDITIHAALFALNKSYEFERYDRDKLLGTITLIGSICQNRRGAVGLVGASGYSNKDYTHDRRMSYDTPPHFLEPTNAGWEIVSWNRVTPSE